MDNVTKQQKERDYDEQSPVQGQKNACNKRKSASDFIQELASTKYVKGQREYYFYITLTMPSIELIWCDEYEGQDAYTHPIYEQILNRTQWMKDNHFAGIYSRRASRSVDSITYNKTPPKSGQTCYPRRYYLRIVDPNTSTVDSRRAILEKCVQVSNNYSKI
jgi:hypothetical protein